MPKLIIMVSALFVMLLLLMVLMMLVRRSVLHRTNQPIVVLAEFCCLVAVGDAYDHVVDVEVVDVSAMKK